MSQKNLQWLRFFCQSLPRELFFCHAIISLLRYNKNINILKYNFFCICRLFWWLIKFYYVQPCVYFKDWLLLANFYEIYKLLHFFGRFLTNLKSQEKFSYKTPKFFYIFCFKKEWQPCNQPSTCKTYPDGSLAFPFFILSITHCTPSTTIQHTPPTTLLATEFTPTYFQ